jgi:hypothetical protein
VGASIVGGNNIILDLLNIIEKKNKNNNKKIKKLDSKIFPVIKFIKA